MYIKANPVVPTEDEYIGFQLDTSKIKTHSADTKKIMLPYSGELPDKLRENDGAFVFITIHPGLSVDAWLKVRHGKTDLRYLLAASTQEINDLLFALLFVEKDNNRFNTAWECGLTHYWLGHYQTAYSIWRRLVYEGFGIDNVIAQLSPQALQNTIQYIDNLRKSA